MCGTVWMLVGHTWRQPCPSDACRTGAPGVMRRLCRWVRPERPGGRAGGKCLPDGGRGSPQSGVSSVSSDGIQLPVYPFTSPT